MSDTQMHRSQRFIISAASGGATGHRNQVEQGEDSRRGEGGRGGETEGRQIAHDDSWLLFTCRWKVVALLLYDMTVIGLN